MPIMSVYRLPQGRGYVVNPLMPQASFVVSRKKRTTFKVMLEMMYITYYYIGAFRTWSYNFRNPVSKEG